MEEWREGGMSLGDRRRSYAWLDGEKYRGEEEGGGREGKRVDLPCLCGIRCKLLTLKRVHRLASFCWREVG